ncbi:MAG: tetratricopeptide repeat protein, partial [Kiritimatiellae bacterium]|nr:tetratricopeptide repeat protein [Kiritimatiellia bacterium]
MKNNFRRRVVLTLSLMLSYGISLVAAGADVLSNSDRLLFAEGLYSRRLYKQAADEYVRYLEDFPSATNSDALYCKLGESLRLSGDLQGACQAFYKVAKLKDSKYNTEALLKLASMLLDVDNEAEAEKISNMLLKKNVSTDILAEALYLHGSALVRLGKLDEAITDFDRLVRECGSSRFLPYAKVALGSLLADPQKNQLQRAETLLTEAIASKLPTSGLEVESYFYLGCVRYWMKKYREASNDFLALIQKHPTDPRLNDVYIKLAWSYFFVGMYTEAGNLVVDVLQNRGGFTNSQLGELRYVAANSFFEVSNYDKAIELYKSVVDVDPESSFGQKSSFNLARAYYNKEMYDQAISTLRPILHHKTLREDAVWLTAESATAMKDTALAIQNYRMIVNEFPQSKHAEEAMYRIGCVYRAAKQREEAAAAFLNLSEKYPKSKYAAEALFFAAHIFSTVKDNRSIELWKRFIKEFPNDAKAPVAIYHLAIDENLRGSNDMALEAFILLYTKYPQCEYAGEAYMWAGNLFSIKGELAEAEKALRKALTYKLVIDSEQKAKFMLALVLQKQNKEDEAISILKGLLDNNVAESFTPQHLAWLSRSLIDRKQWAEAEKAAIKLAGSTQSTEAWKQAAWALAAKAAIGAGKKDVAETYYRNALGCGAKTRDYIECCYLLGELLMQKKNFKEAGERFVEAAKLSTDMPEFHELRIYSYIGHGRSAIAQGKRDEGIRLLMAASLLFSHDTLVPPIMDEVIILLNEDGRKEDAALVKEDLLRLYPNSNE